MASLNTLSSVAAWSQGIIDGAIPGVLSTLVLYWPFSRFAGPQHRP